MKKLLGSLIFGCFVFAATAAQAANAIVTTNLNYRTGPGTRYGVIGSIPNGQPVDVASCSGNWCQINYGGRVGWASSRYLAFRSSNDAYKSYAPSASSLNVIIGSGYYNDYYGGYYRNPYRDRRYYRHYDRHRPRYYGNYRPHRPPPGMRPPHFRPGPGMPPPPNFRPGPGMRPPHGGMPTQWSHRPMRPPMGHGMGHNMRPGGHFGGRPH